MASEELLKADKKPSPRRLDGGKKRKWVKPMLEDVSGKVMAQPYIRFT